MYLEGSATFNRGTVTQMLEALPLGKNCTLLQTGIDMFPQYSELQVCRTV